MKSRAVAPGVGVGDEGAAPHTPNFIRVLLGRFVLYSVKGSTETHWKIHDLHL